MAELAGLFRRVTPAPPHRAPAAASPTFGSNFLYRGAGMATPNPAAPYPPSMLPTPPELAMPEIRPETSEALAARVRSDAAALAAAGAGSAPSPVATPVGIRPRARR